MSFYSRFGALGGQPPFGARAVQRSGVCKERAGREHVWTKTQNCQGSRQDCEALPRSPEDDAACGRKKYRQKAAMRPHVRQRRMPTMRVNSASARAPPRARVGRRSQCQGRGPPRPDMHSGRGRGEAAGNLLGRPPARCGRPWLLLPRPQAIPRPRARRRSARHRTSCALPRACLPSGRSPPAPRTVKGRASAGERDGGWAALVWEGAVTRVVSAAVDTRGAAMDTRRLTFSIISASCGSASSSSVGACCCACCRACCCAFRSCRAADRRAWAWGRCCAHVPAAEQRRQPIWPWLLRWGRR